MTGPVLVTGSSGYLGSETVLRLAAAGIPVVPSARRPTPELAACLGKELTALDVMGDLPSLHGIECVVHCATPNDIDSREEDGGLPLAVLGTRRLMEHASRAGVRRFVFLSTLQVYGTELNGRIDEDTAPFCETTYGLNHLLGEEVCRFHARLSGMDVVALRPANVYGVPAVTMVNRWTLVPMCFVREAARTGRIVLRSSGRQRRNFVSTGEVADLIVELCRNFPSGFHIVNAGSNWTCSVGEIAAMVAQRWRLLTGRELAVESLSDQPATGNEFTVESAWAALRPAPEASRAEMVATIDALIADATRPAREMEDDRA